MKTVWAEFISDDPMGEVTWAQGLAHTTGRPQGMIGLVDFASPEVERTLDLYTSIEPVRVSPDKACPGRPRPVRTCPGSSDAGTPAPCGQT